MKAYLVLIETSGNQQFIFSTNKLRENVGASELTYRLGTEWTLKAVKAAGGPDLWPLNQQPTELRANLVDRQRNYPIESEKSPVEVIVATSGKAILLVREKDVGKRIISEVTGRAIREAPGIDVCGVIGEEFEWEDCGLSRAFYKVHDLFEEAHAQRPGPLFRFLRLPVVAECASSGLPAAEWKVPDGEDRIEAAARSAVTLSKWKFRPIYRDRMKTLLHGFQANLQFADQLDDFIRQLEEEGRWIAVVHADGNGLGQILLDFDQYADLPPISGNDHGERNREYVNKLRRFSLALDKCTEEAFFQALGNWIVRDEEVYFRLKLPILPIVLGGDDLTVVCDGRAALPLTRDFLRAFEEKTAQPVKVSNNDSEEEQEIIQNIARRALHVGRLSACAGIAVIKPHYPFSAAYELAENLIRSAKRVKEVVKTMSPQAAEGGEKSESEIRLFPCSALDFHIHYDTSGSDLDEIRGRLTFDGALTKETTRLFGRPYVVTGLESLKDAGGLDWVKQHDWDRLEELVRALKKRKVDGRRELPNSQMHELRAGLFLGREVANARYRLIRQRYPTMEIFDGVSETLFLRENDTSSKSDETVYFTRLLDALDAATIYDPEEEEPSADQDILNASGGKR